MPMTLVSTACAARWESTKFASMAVVCMFFEFGFTLSTVVMEVVWNLGFGDRMKGYGIAAVLLLLVTACMASICWRNFNKGLKAYLQQSSLPDALSGAGRAHNRTTPGPQSQNLLSARMPLD